jgi:O-antigen/teichoic acid export membrane protein
MSIRRDTLWNLAGMGLPLLAAAALIPYTLNGLGAEGFGVVTLIWALIGYFAFFDLGMGRALTYQISKLCAAGQEDGVRQTMALGLTITFLAGLLGAFVLIVLAEPLSSDWLKISPEWQNDAKTAFQVAAIGIIPTTVASGVRGVLEGFHRFAAVNIVRVAFGFCTFALPALCVWIHGRNLTFISLYLVCARVLVVVVGFFQLRHYLRPNFAGKKAVQVRSLLTYGVWVTVSGVVGPMMIYGDRFFVGALLGAATLPFYAIPQEALQRLLIIPAALSAALLPRLSAIGGASLNHLINNSYRQVALVMFIVCAITVVCSDAVLSWWISPHFANNAMPVVMVLAVGVWVNSIAQVPYTLIHALGNPKLTALLHIFELLFYFFLLYWLTREFDLLGAAVAWLIRVLFDCAFLFFAANQMLKKVKIDEA